MSNTILKEQNSPEMLRYLRAQRVAYSSVKKLQFPLEILAVLAALGIPVCIVFYPEVKTTVGLVCSGISLFAYFADRYFKAKTKEAASIQEKFDRVLFGLPSTAFTKAIPVSSERIIELAQKYRGSDLTNWYSKHLKPEYPQELAVLLCQKINLVWDWKLRNKYRNLIIAFSILYTIVILLTVYLITTKTDEFISTFSLILFSNVGLLRYLGSIIDEKKTVINEKKGHSITVDDLLTHGSSTDSTLISKASELQSAIFDSRNKHHKVPDWFARLHRPKLEILIDEMVSQTVSDHSLRQGK